MSKDILEVIPEDPEDMAREYYEVKEKINQLEKKRQLLRESLFKLFEEDETNEIQAGKVKVYRVSRERVQWDEKILKLILKPLGLWESVLSVDNSKIKDLLDKKMVDESLIKNAGTTTQTWYIYTQKITPETIPLNRLSTSTSHSEIKHPPQVHESIKDKTHPPIKKDKIGEKIITITDLSRMGGDRVCIFGLDYKGTPIRPTLPSGIRERHLFDGNDNVFIKPFAQIKFNLLRNRPQYPHSEDYFINPRMKPELVRNLTPEQSESLLNENLYSGVDEIFGAPIHEYRYLRQGEGKRSLGTIKADRILFFDYGLKDNGKYEYRITFNDASGFTYNLPITDCAFRNYCNNLKDIQEGNIQSIRWKLLGNLNKKRVYLRVGLTREFRDVHWLQVSGIHTFPDYKNG
ncbi:MAG: hypothetical protein ACC614_06285 [Methanobacterium formicicum]|uniref:dual OB domain-containing protein n=1 Tax=Methanobacterium formicicum TaxID=2162 RepID=UPI003530BB09